MAFSKQAAETHRSAHDIGYTFEPLYPNGTGIGATITVRGPESDVIRALLKQRMTEAHARDLAARKDRRDPPPVSLEQIEQDAIELAVAYTLDWEGFEDSGQPMACTPDNLRTIYKTCPWIRRQVIDEAQDLGNFVRPIAPASSSTLAPSSAST